MKYLIITIFFFVGSVFLLQAQKPKVLQANFYYNQKITNTVLSCNSCDEKENRIYQLRIEGIDLDGYELQKEKVFYSIKCTEYSSSKLCYNICFTAAFDVRKIVAFKLKKNTETLDIKLNTAITVKSDMF